MNAFVSSRQYTRDLRRLSLTVAAGVAGFGVLLLAIIAYAGWSANSSGAEREHRLVANALNRAITRTLDDLKSVAWWDDAVVNVTDRHINYDFADANFGAFLTETYAHDEVYVLNGAGQPVYAFFNQHRQAPTTFELRAADVSPLLAEMAGAPARLQQRAGVFAQGDYRFLAGGGRSARWSGHIISVGGRPAIVAAMTIVPNVDMSLAPAHPHVLLSITYLDAPYLNRLGQALLLPDLQRDATPLHVAGRASQPFVTDDGVRLGELSWTTKQPGEVLLTIILPLAALGVLLAGLLSFNLLRRLMRASAGLARREAATRHEAKHDALSGLPNRSFFLQQLDEALSLPRADGTPARIAVAYIDIDRFKDVNDTLGHDAGDELVKAVAARLRAHLRPRDFLARLGGDEYAVFCTESGPGEPMSLAAVIAGALSEPFPARGGQIRVTASIGLSQAPQDGMSSGALLRNADIALYEAKSRGRDCAVVFDEQMANAVEMRRMIELDLHTAVADGDLGVNYLPVVSASNGEIVGVEALLRWRHARRGAISPAVFTPIAEDLGLMPAIGEQVLRRAFADAARWRDLEVSVNLSRSQFRDPKLPALLDRLAADHAVAPGRVMLEITEGVLLDNGSRVEETLETLRRKGFKVALDDFGAGYSSLAHLCNFRFDKIKIDRAFVRNAARREAARAIVQAVVTLGRGLGMEIVAEGVETEGDAITMRSLGCHELQGFFFSRPTNQAGIDALLQRTPSEKPAAAAPPVKLAARD